MMQKQYHYAIAIKIFNASDTEMRREGCFQAGTFMHIFLHALGKLHKMITLTRRERRNLLLKKMLCC